MAIIEIRGVTVQCDGCQRFIEVPYKVDFFDEPIPYDGKDVLTWQITHGYRRLADRDFCHACVARIKADIERSNP